VAAGAAGLSTAGGLAGATGSGLRARGAKRLLEHLVQAPRHFADRLRPAGRRAARAEVRALGLCLRGWDGLRGRSRSRGRHGGGAGDGVTAGAGAAGACARRGQARRDLRARRRLRLHRGKRLLEFIDDRGRAAADRGSEPPPAGAVTGWGARVGWDVGATGDCAGPVAGWPASLPAAAGAASPEGAGWACLRGGRVAGSAGMGEVVPCAAALWRRRRGRGHGSAGQANRIGCRERLGCGNWRPVRTAASGALTAQRSPIRLRRRSGRRSGADVRHCRAG